MLNNATGRMLCVCAAACMGVSAMALGQGAAPPAGKPALGGPAVKDREVPGVRDAFGEGDVGKFMRGERMPLKVFVDSLKVLTDEASPADIRATAEQESSVRAMVEKFQKEQREYQAAHREDLRKLREGAGDAVRRPAKKGDAPSQGPDEQMAGGDQAPSEDMRARRMAAAEKMREIERNAPRVEDLYTKVWETLSDPQRKAVDARLDVWRQERSKDREDAYVRQRMAKKGEGPAPKATDKAPEGAPTPPMRRPLAGDDATRAERRQRLLRVFEQLPAEQQDRILDRLEQQLRDNGGAPERRRDARPDGANKPAPSVERVKVPAPDSGEPDKPKNGG